PGSRPCCSATFGTAQFCEPGRETSFPARGVDSRSQQATKPKPLIHRRARSGRALPFFRHALALCELLAATDRKRYERAALRWLQRFIDERLPLDHRGRSCRVRARRAAQRPEIRGVDALKRIVRR